MPGVYFIEDDLAEHDWYVELVADFIEAVERFLMQLPELDG